MILWVLGILAMLVGYAGTLPEQYPTEADRLLMAEAISTPAMTAMLGSVYYLEDGSFSHGALYSAYMTVWAAAIIALMNILHVIRHTRQDEERGRIEVIRSLPTGRLSNLSATLTSAVIINIVIALLTGLGLGSLGVEGIGTEASLLFGILMGATGILFATVTAIFSQLSANPRTAASFSYLFLGGAFILRAMGAIRESNVLTNISPLGIITQAKVFTEDLWWPVIVLLLVSILAAALAFWLCSVRDMGEGIIAAKLGRKDAPPFLKNPEGLAWRLLRMPFIAWAFIMLFLGMSFGSLMGDMELIIESNELWQTISEGDPMRLTTFFVLALSILSTIPVLQFMLRARSQEAQGYAENILSRSSSRYGQLRGYFSIAAISCLVMPFASAFGLWSAGYAVMENPIAFSDFLSACFVYIPAMLGVLGVAVFLVGFLPRFTTLVWAYFGYGFAVLFFGPLLGLPSWFAKLSPFGHIPNIPIDEHNVGTTIIITLLAAIISVVGFVGYRNRNMVFSQ
jgi:ABC-2 type transport system permease protein